MTGKKTTQSNATISGTMKARPAAPGTMPLPPRKPMNKGQLCPMIAAKATMASPSELPSKSNLMADKRHYDLERIAKQRHNSRGDTERAPHVGRTRAAAAVLTDVSLMKETGNQPPAGNRPGEITNYAKRAYARRSAMVVVKEQTQWRPLRIPKCRRILFSKKRRCEK